jgi:hypothetical protein
MLALLFLLALLLAAVAAPVAGTATEQAAAWAGARGFPVFPPRPVLR